MTVNLYSALSIVVTSGVGMTTLDNPPINLSDATLSGDPDQVASAPPDEAISISSKPDRVYAGFNLVQSRPTHPRPNNASVVGSGTCERASLPLFTLTLNVESRKRKSLRLTC